MPLPASTIGPPEKSRAGSARSSGTGEYTVTTMAHTLVSSCERYDTRSLSGHLVRIGLLPAAQAPDVRRAIAREPAL